jgi:hypothetical protein
MQTSNIRCFITHRLVMLDTNISDVSRKIVGNVKEDIDKMVERL